MTSRVTSNSNARVKTPTVKKNEKTKKIDIAKAMMEFAEQNTGAVGKDEFQALLKKINKNNVISVIKQYDSISPDKSIIAMILGETGSNDEEMQNALTGKGNGKTAVRGLFTLLLDKAKDAGVDADTIANFETEFDKELDKQLGNDGFFSQIRSLAYIDSTRLDTIMRALVQTIDNKTSLPQADSQTIKSTPATKLQADTNNIIGKRYNKALKDFNEQLARDGWAGDVADFWGKLFSENNADAVREDLKICKKQHEELVAARKQGDAAYKAKFKEIFGVAYNPANIVTYQKAEARYIEASKAKAQEDNFKSTFSALLNSDRLQEEKTNVTSSTTGVGNTITTATKEQVFNREYRNFANLLGEQGEAIIEEKFKEAGVENKSIDEKFKVLQILAKAVAANLHNNTMKATGGVEFESVQKHYENCYKAAFGLDNDIMKRVTDYNISQQKGSGLVKGAAVMAVVTACALTGQVEGFVAVAGVAAGTTAAVEITDAASQKRNIDAFKEGGLEAYIKSVGKNTDWSGIAKASLTSGAMMLAIGGVAYPVANLCRIGASAAGLTGKALDIATALGTNTAISAGVLGTQYLMKGEISTEDAVFVVIMAVVGSTIQVVQINRAYAAAENAAVDAHMQNIQDARRTLGFEDGVEITPDMLKQQYKKMALANHPDRGGSAVNMAVINSANDYLQAHIADINIALTGAQPQTINPTMEAVRGNTNPQNNPVSADGSNSTALATIENLMEFRNIGYNLSTTPQNQIIAYTPEGQAVEVGTLGKTSLVEVQTNLSNIKPAGAVAEHAPAKPETPQLDVKTQNIAELPNVEQVRLMNVEQLRKLAQTPEGLALIQDAGIGTTTVNPTPVKTINGVVEHHQVLTTDGQVISSSLVVTRVNGTQLDVLQGIPQETLQSPVMQHIHQTDASTINPSVGIVITQNASKPVIARVIELEGTLENSLVNNNNHNIPIKYDTSTNTPYADTPWNPGRQDITGKCLQVTYGTVKEDWGARPEYIKEYANPETGEAPDVGTLAAQKGTEDRSFMPADIAGKQYEIVTESGERIPCNYEDMQPGVDYFISKKAGVELKMAVPPTEVKSSEGELLPAGALYMVDSNGHFYNGNPIKRIKSGEVNWNADMNDPAQAQIRADIDEALRLEAEAKEAGKAGNKELKDQLNAQAKQLTAKAEQEMTEWVKSAQNPDGTDFFVAEKPTGSKPYVKPETKTMSAQTESDIASAPKTEVRLSLGDESRIMSTKGISGLWNRFTDSDYAYSQERAELTQQLADNDIVEVSRGENSDYVTVKVKLSNSEARALSAAEKQDIVGHAGNVATNEAEDVVVYKFDRVDENGNAVFLVPNEGFGFHDGNNVLKYVNQVATGKVQYAHNETIPSFKEFIGKNAPTDPNGGIHASIIDGEFGALGTKSAKQVGAEFKAYAEENGLKFIDRGSEFEIQDANGNTVREAHEGLFDGRWYDHHQVFNENNQITNRFVLNNKGQLQSTVEFFYDETGKQTMSVGYGGKAGTDVMVFEGSKRSQMTIQEFVDKYGFEPKYYRELNPGVKFKSPEPAAANPVQTPVFSVTSSATPKAPASTTADFAKRLADFKGPDGKRLLSTKEIKIFLESKGGLGGNVQAKVEAILSNPKEVADIIRYKNRAMGLWRAIYEPMDSTIDANPELFGVKPKASPKPAPAQSTKPAALPKIQAKAGELADKWFPNKNSNLSPEEIQTNRNAIISDIIRTVSSGANGDEALMIKRLEKLANNRGYSTVHILSESCKNSGFLIDNIETVNKVVTRDIGRKMGPDLYAFLDNLNEQSLAQAVQIVSEPNPIPKLKALTYNAQSHRVELGNRRVSVDSSDAIAIISGRQSMSYYRDGNSNAFESTVASLVELPELKPGQQYYYQIVEGILVQRPDLADIADELTMHIHRQQSLNPNKKILDIQKEFFDGLAQSGKLPKTIELSTVVPDENALVLPNATFELFKQGVAESAKPGAINKAVRPKVERTLHKQPAETPLNDVKPAGTAKSESDLKQALYSSKPAQEFNQAEFQKWADENGLELTYSDDMQRAIFLDKTGNMVRIINADRNNLTRVYDDAVYFFDSNHHTTGILKRIVGGTEVYLSNTDGKIYIKNENGIWEQSKTKEVPINNPITGEPQVSSVKPATEPAPAQRTNPVTVSSLKEMEQIIADDYNAEAPVRDVPKKEYSSPETSVKSVTTGDDIMTSDGYSPRSLWNRLKSAVGFGDKTLDSVLETARKEGALVEETAPGEYKVTQRHELKNAKLQPVGHTADKYRVETIAFYKDGNPEPVDVVRYTHDYFGENPVVQGTTREGENLTHYIIDRKTGYGVEYSGYDANGNKIAGQKQVVRIIGKNQNVLKEYSGEDIENALFVPTNNETDRHSQPLLDVEMALSPFGVSQSIVEWQAVDGTRYLVDAGKRFKPENFVREVKPENIQEYTAVSSDTPAFSAKMNEYNEFARVRNLTIEEVSTANGKTIQFKDSNGRVVRSILADKNGTSIRTDEFFALNRDGEIVQSVTKDGSGNIISRTINEYRQWWGKACTVTLDYVKGEAHTGLWLHGELTNQKTVSLESGISQFKTVAGY